MFIIHLLVIVVLIFCLIAIIKGAFKAIPYVFLFAMLFLVLPLYIPYAMVFHYNKENRWGHLVLYCMYDILPVGCGLAIINLLTWFWMFFNLVK